MTERPILFSGPMVRAILEGRKTQTRRQVKAGVSYGCPYGKPGDRLWVREAWRTGSSLDKWSGKVISDKALEVGYYRKGSTNPCCPLYYEADGYHRKWSDYDVQDFGKPGRYRHARFMPRWASRITLEIVSVRYESLNEISEEDAEAEGITGDEAMIGQISRPFATAFASLWQSINGPGTFDDRWIWVVEFKVLEGQG